MWSGADRLEAHVGCWTWRREIRVRDSSVAFRVIYLMSRPEAIYVLHCFQKKTQTTTQSDIELAQKRLKMVPR